MDCGLYDPTEVWQELRSPGTLSAASDLLHWAPLCTIALLYPCSFPNTNRNYLDYRQVSRWLLGCSYAFFGGCLVMSPHLSLNGQLYHSITLLCLASFLSM